MTNDQTLAAVMRGLMNNAPGGPLTVSSLARRAGVPRSTVHRHLLGGRMIMKTVRIYARALGVSEEYLARLAGFAVPNAGRDQVMEALAYEIQGLDRASREVVWDVIALLRRHGLLRRNTEEDCHE